jgi:hypothetical protein
MFMKGENVTFLEILQTIAAIATILTGLISLMRPHAIKGFTGLETSGPRGVTEIRSILGGVFIGIGLAPLFLKTPEAFQMLGFTYLVIGAVRAVTMFLDKSVVRSNVISLVVEIVFGVILVL